MSSTNGIATDPREIAMQTGSLIQRAYPDFARANEVLIARCIATMTDFAPPGVLLDPYARAEPLLPDLWRHERSSMDEVVHQLAEREIGARMDRIERDARRGVIALRSGFRALDDAVGECAAEIAARRNAATATSEEMDGYGHIARTVRIVAETLLLVTGGLPGKPAPVSDVVARALEARRAAEDVLELEASIRQSIGREYERLDELERRLQVIGERAIGMARHDRAAFIATQRRYGVPAALLLLALGGGILLLLHRVSPALMWLVAAGGAALAFVPAGDDRLGTGLWSCTVRRIERAAQRRRHRLHGLPGLR